jgi:hypothetical protein
MTTAAVAAERDATRRAVWRLLRVAPSDNTVVMFSDHE